MMRQSQARAALTLTASILALSLLSGCGLFKKAEKPSLTVGERISVLDFEKQAQAEADLQGIDVTLPPQEVNASWTQPGGNAAGNMGHLALSGSPSPLWSASVGEGGSATRKLNGAPVIEANRVFVMDTKAQVSAFDATTGQSLWRKTIELDGEGDNPAFGGGVSVIDGRVIATTGYGLVVAFDAGTGTELWRKQVATPLRAAPAVADGRIYVSTQDGQLLAYSADNGEQLWDANATVEPASIFGAGAPAVALNTVVAGFPSGELFALRVENGRTMWQDQLSRTGRTTALGALSGIAAAPLIDRGRVIAISHGGRMVAMELATGQRVWERELAGVHAPVAAGDWIFVVTVDGELLALTRGEGKIRWVSNLGQWKNEKKKKGAIQWAGPVLAGDRLILVSSEGEMVYVSPSDGTVQSRHKLSSAAYLSPVVANGVLYVLTDDGKLSAYR